MNNALQGGFCLLRIYHSKHAFISKTLAGNVTKVLSSEKYAVCVTFINYGADKKKKSISS